LPNEFAAFGISGGGLKELFSTHPPLEIRIRALESGR
ncbi:MAG TPA: protease HtpX, partial [Gammaproteobacteria bacterium]|nr:protease HtpX [Gammaproteobacteria bacterium]